MTDEQRGQRAAYVQRFAARLRVLLGGQGVSVHELARRTGLSPSAVQRYARGDVLPDVYAVCLMAQALAVGVDALVSGADSLPGVPTCQG